MIDWKRRALELAEVVNRHREDRKYEDYKLAWEIAEELLEMGKREGEAQQKFLESWRCPDKKEREKLYNEYLELIK